MSECDCCGYDGADLPRYRGMMHDVLDGLVDKRTAELRAENQRLRDAIELCERCRPYASGAGTCKKSLDDMAALLGGGNGP